MKEVSRIARAALKAAALSFCALQPTHAQTTVVIDPSDDASIYTCSACNNSVAHADLDVFGMAGIQSVSLFPTEAISGIVTQALFSVNPIGLPLYSPQVYIYGFTSDSGTVVGEHANSGSFLGILNLPPDLSYGQDAYFDVTDFVANNSALYIGFNLRAPTGYGDLFSSIYDNYGHPEQLIVTTIPEPETYAMLLAGLGLLGFVAHFRERNAAQTDPTAPSTAYFAGFSCSPVKPSASHRKLN